VLRYYHADHLGTPLKMTDAAAAPAWAAEYRPFGDLDSWTGPLDLNRLRLPGQYFDAETGYHQNWHRDYAPRLGRYLQADPLGVGGGLALYPYAENLPLRFIDPFGLYEMGDVIYRCDPFDPGACDVSMVWYDPTPDEDDDDNEIVATFGPAYRAASGQACRPPGGVTQPCGIAVVVPINDVGDPYAGYKKVCAYQPEGRRPTRKEYEERLAKWFETNRLWAPQGFVGKQCYNFVGDLHGVSAARQSSWLGFDITYWTSRCNSPESQR
jgi:RHS repeat-associated protein